MAQQTAIKIRRSSVAGKIPLTTDLVLGELALNTNDGVLYFKKSPSGVDSIVALQPYTGGTGVSVSASGVISIGQSVATTANVNFATGVFTDPSAGSNYTVKIGNATGSVFGIGTGSNSFGIANDALNNAQTGYVPYQVTATQIGFKTSANSYNWSFNADGTTQFPNYKFPAAAGTNGQILSTDGLGNVSWISNNSTSPATSSSLGVVQVDGTTIVANGSGVISARSLVNGSYSAVLDSTGTLTVNNLTVNATTTVNSQTLVVQGIGNLFLSQDGQYLTLPNGQPVASNNAYNVVLIGANSGSFYFSSGGTLKLPPNGDILDSNGNSVLNLNGRVVSYGVTQNLTSTQQLTARSNIGLDDATLYFYSYMFG